MATGTLSSLGLGSEVLNQETLEKLKNADISARVKPYETKIETNTTKQKALTELTTKLAAFQSAVSSLGDSTAFGKRKVTPSVTGDSAAATLTASNGVSVQNLSVKVEKIAQKDVFQSGGITKDTDKVLQTGQPASFTIMQNGKEYTIKVEATTTYADLAEKINSATDGKVIAKIVSTGEKGTPYRFTLSSKETGADNAISFFAGTKDSQTGVYTENKDAEAILGNLGWTLKKSGIAEADMKGFAFSGGTKASSVKQLSDNLTTDVKFTLWAGTEKFEIDFKKTKTYQDLIDEVKSKTSGKIELKAVKDGSGDYTFNFVAGDKASSSTKIKIFDGTMDASAKTYTSDNDTTNFLQNTLNIGISKSYSLDDAKGTAHLKKAQDAEFTLDGVKMYRSTNEIKDIGAGLTLNLLKAGEINFDIKQDSEGLTSTMEELVEKYNELVNYLNDVTAYDSETKVSGDLADVIEIKNLRSSINKILFTSQSVEGTTTDDNGNKTKTNVLVSVLDFGLSLNDTSKSNSSQLALLKFDSAKFEKKFAEDPDFAESFFSGTSGFEEVNVVGKAQTFDSTEFQNGLDFKGKDFKITFGDVSYDLTKTADGKSDFKLESTLTKNTGETDDEFKARKAQDIAQKLLDHINSFGINGLKVSMQEFTLTENGVQKKGYALKFKSDDGSDFEISGDKELLTKLGLEAQKINPETKTGTGVFSQLKSTLQSYTKVSTVDTKKGTLTLYSDKLKADAKALGDEKTKEQTRIDAYYEAMFSKWVQYDAIIASIKKQGTAITNMINAANNQNSK